MGIRQQSLRPTAAIPIAALAAGIGLSIATNAHADEPRKTSEPFVLREPTEIVQVADAFDDGDLFDLHLSLGYQSTWKTARIYRETSILQEGLSTGGYTASNLNVAEYKEQVSRLNTRADIGIYKDIALVVRLPVILSDERSLDAVDGSDAQQTTVLQGAPGEQLFRLPFDAPTRSGIEYLALGLDFGIMNQARVPTAPSWVFGGEVRLNVSEPMHACNKNPTSLNQNPTEGQVKCAHSSDIDRNGVGGATQEGKFSGDRDPGVSRGTTGLALHTYLSRRVKYIEPYGGFHVLFEFPVEDSDYRTTDLKGTLVNHPPLRGTMLVGMAVMPWEVKDAFQRLTIDGRFTGTYVSEGRDYSELFDALGSSDAPSLRIPQHASYRATGPDDNLDTDLYPSVVDPNSQLVYFTGLTDVQQHGIYQFSLSATYQAGEYVKFNVGGSYTLIQGHFVTFDQACNPDFDNDVGAAGPCRSSSGEGSYNATGIPNPNFRKVINDPGQRFKVDDATALDAWLSATVMF
jgi:hypothetical protein